ncbi:MAG: hypothetical protein HY606_02195 [Planctomycetes bacterium]|nr:hypothetical protein [Planctomycetota bacterium]
MKLIVFFGLLFQASGDDKAIDEQIKQLEQRLKKDEIRVTIKKTNAKVEDIIQEFRKQIQINIIAKLDRVPEDFVIDKFEVEEVPFKEAWEHFLELATLTVVEETANVIVIERPAILEAISYRDSDIKTVFETLAKISGASIIPSPKITGTVSLTMTNVPWYSVLQAITKTLGYATVKEKYDIIRIVTAEELYQQLETRVFGLKYIQPPRPYRPKKVEDPYIKSKEVEVAGGYEEILKQFAFLRLIEVMLSKDAQNRSIGSYSYDTQTNTLVVKDIKPVLDSLDKMIKRLDVEPLQVALDVTFVTTRNEDLLTFGMDYFGSATSNPGLEITNRTFPLITDESSSLKSALRSKFPFGINSQQLPSNHIFFTDYETRAVLRAFKKDTYSKLEQRPNINVIDGSEATIFVGEQVPYAVANIIVQPGSPPQATLVEGSKSPVQIGFQLLVMPRVLSEEGKVHLTIIPKNVVLTGSDPQQPGFERFKLQAFGSTLELLLPRLGETALMTTLVVEDGQTAVIGGLVVNKVSLEDKGLPFLKDIPIIGYAFKLRSDTKINEYLLIFITPRIIRNSEDVAKVLNYKIQKKQIQLLEELKKLKEKK